MIYVVNIDGRHDLKVTLNQSRRGIWTARIGDRRGIELAFRGRTDGGAYHFVIDGKSRTFRLDKNCTKYLLDDGERVARVGVERAAEVLLEHDHRAESSPKSAVDRLESTITGVVLDVLVSPGQRVKSGEPIIAIEAMKMENTLVAPKTCTVASVRSQPGQTVYAGDELITFRT